MVIKRKMFKKNNGLNEKIKNLTEDMLIPAIIQDFKTSEVLMLAYMNKESLEKSLETGYTWFYSRKRKKLWEKGETSGNTQEIKQIYYDCDRDTLLIKVIQNGPACHTGNKTCFFTEIDLQAYWENKNTKELLANIDLKFGNYSGFSSNNQETKETCGFLDELYDIIKERILQKSENSYTFRLHMKGLDEIIKKFGEESIEIVLAAKHQDKKKLVYEIADLFYHLTVLMVEKNISYSEILKELISRKK